MDSEFNVLAVLAASVAAMFLGGLWYSPLLFEKRWRRLVRTSDDQEAGNPVVIYGGAFALILLSAAVFHVFLGPIPTSLSRRALVSPLALHGQQDRYG